MPEVHVTDAAYRRIQALREETSKPCMLRVAVLGGGCSGFQYSIELAEQPEPDDTVFEQDGNCVLVDSISLPFLSGATVDYRAELIGARFQVDNPNTRSTCGCGTSFSF